MWNRFFQEDFSEVPTDVSAEMEAMIERAQQIIAELFRPQGSIYLTIIQPIAPAAKKNNQSPHRPSRPRPLSTAEVEKTGEWLDGFKGDFNQFLK